MAPAEPMLDARYDAISFKVVNNLLSHDSLKNLHNVRCQGNKAVAFRMYYYPSYELGDDRLFVAKWDYTVV